MPRITVSAVVMRDIQGRVLTVRKRGTSSFMFPGGKPETGEEPRAAAVREVREELGVDIAPHELEVLGRWETQAANEAGHELVAHVFDWVRSPEYVVRTPIFPLAEIEELRWSVPADSLAEPDIAPLTRDCVFPLLASTERSELGR
ncbi:MULTISPECIES: NUDIX hydrolase [Micrococcaceae]|uniref:NUDIX hydrolase n=1 Tax=unclassified Kocuria TaxID=2649579 RepID=UPI0010125A5C|nr:MULTISPECIES: NUDIX domain-containing protein [unclassified Kocuria]